MIDENTSRPFRTEGLKTEESQRAQMDDHIYMDAMGFGMGNSCLQVTFQASSICEAKHLYDQLLGSAISTGLEYLDRCLSESEKK